MLRKAMRESALMAPPLHAVGARVAVAFQNHTKLFAGSVTACRLQHSGRPVYDVDFDDGETHEGLLEEALRPEWPAAEAIERVAARRPMEADATREQAQLPIPNLPVGIQPDRNAV